MLRKFRFIGLALVLVLSLGLAACGNSDNGGSSSDNGSSKDEGSSNGGGSSSGADLGDKDISIPYVSWAGVVARTYLLAAVLEDVGYNVTPKQVEAGPMWASTANDKDTINAAAWLPATHADYWKKYKDNVTKVNQVLDKAPLGLVVPKYMKDVNSVEDLKGNSKLGDATNWQITGIDPGAGIMKNTNKALKKYGLDKWKLQQSSESGMLSQLKREYAKKKPIIITGWKPHYMFAKWDLKMLKDPKKVYGGNGDKIYVVANKDFKDKHPAASKVLKQYEGSYDLLNDLMGKIQDGKKPEDVAKQYMKDHPDQVKKWEKGVK